MLVGLVVSKLGSGFKGSWFEPDRRHSILNLPRSEDLVWGWYEGLVALRTNAFSTPTYELVLP
jgi:hypothetical protein